MTPLHSLKDRYGFWFWLRWILMFAGGFVLSAVAWTLALQGIFGWIYGEELTLTWMVCVFGTWFILVIPFMRKKEQIWKRLNPDQEKSVDSWFLGTSVFIGLLIASALFWDIQFKTKLVPDSPGIDGDWAKAVFGSWFFFLIPFLILMYRQADKIFKTAVERQTYRPRFRSLWIDPKKRQLPQEIVFKILSTKATLPGAHVVRLKLKNGQELSNVFVVHGGEVAGIYDYQKDDFDASLSEDVEISSPDSLPAYDEEKWVRFNLKDNP